MSVTLEICQGTTCFVMGSSDLLSVEEYLPREWRDKVTITGTACLDRCRNNRYGKAPYVRIDGEVFESATVASILVNIAERLGISDYSPPKELL